MGCECLNRTFEPAFGFVFAIGDLFDARNSSLGAGLEDGVRYVLPGNAALDNLPSVHL